MKEGVEGPLLFIADGLPGIYEEIRQLHSRADFPHHRHASRNLEFHVRVQNRNEIDSGLREIFISRTREEALDQFAELKDKWSSRYPRNFCNMKKNLFILLRSMIILNP